VPSIPWDTIRPAIQKWIAEASGRGVSHVIWADDGGDQPELPYISLSLPITTPHGTDWRIYDPAPEDPPLAGQELRVRSQGMRTATLTVQCFAVRGSVNAASSMLEDVVASIPLFADAIDAAGAGIGDVGAVKAVAGSRSGVLEPRAILEITLQLGSEAESRETYIETAHGTVRESTTGASLPLATAAT
jgi:hypothetical protein